MCSLLFLTCQKNLDTVGFNLLGVKGHVSQFCVSFPIDHPAGGSMYDVVPAVLGSTVVPLVVVLLNYCFQAGLFYSCCSEVERVIL